MEDSKPPYRARFTLGLSALLALALACPAVAQDSAAAPPDHADAVQDDATKADRAEQEAWQKTQDDRVMRGDALLKERQPEAAIRDAFDPVIQAYQARYTTDKDYVCARTQEETLAYLLAAAAKMDKGTSSGKSTVALGPTWALAYYGKAYALIEQNQFDLAAVELDRAL